jgi:hypothetical protein
MIITEHNIETGEVIKRDMTKDEAAQHKIDEAARVAMIAKIEADAIAKAALLERLGITAEEATLLLG